MGGTDDLQQPCHKYGADSGLFLRRELQLPYHRDRDSNQKEVTDHAHRCQNDSVECAGLLTLVLDTFADPGFSWKRDAEHSEANDKGQKLDKANR